jgi:deoxyribodipyrimidine photo-lyase
MTTALMVFTRDLRVSDNPALVAAANAEHVVPLFVLDDDSMRGWHRAPNRLGFLVESLHGLDDALRERGGALVVRRGDWVESVATLAHECGATEVHLADDVSAYAQARLGRLRAATERDRVHVEAHPGVTVVPPGEVAPPNATFSKVFTPYHRRWRAHPWRSPLQPPRSLSLPRSLDRGVVPDLRDLTRAPRSPDVPHGGEERGVARLRSWAPRHLEDYAGHNDLVAEANGTSHISPYLHFGCLSPLQVATRMRERRGSEAFVRQLCWRDFHHQVLAARPSAAHADYKPATVAWHDDPDAFDAWRDGRTGYPFVDAGMRQLRQVGWMHNRARLAVASFLTKHLVIDWRAGADHFMSLLVDGDVANNQLNWQWVAGTGTDPNAFRMFNPTRQAARFDPEAAYIKRFVPELEALDARDAHDPSPEPRAELGYPAPIVDHAEAYAAFRARLRS